MYGLIILVIYALVMIGVTLITKEKCVGESYHVGNREKGAFISAMSIAATWIWAPALFTSSEKAYLNGFAGLFWFVVPNVLCLVLFIPFAIKIRKEMPKGITLSGYMQMKYNSKSVKHIYLMQLTLLAILSTAVQLLAGGIVLSTITGIPLWVMTIILSVIAFSYAQISGICASILTDVIQMLFMIGVCLIVVPLAIQLNGGVEMIQLSGISGRYGNLFSGSGIEVLLSFGIPTTIGLLAGPFGDQCFWQRAFSIKEKSISRAFMLGAILFAIVPLSMGVLGFVAAGIGMGSMNAGMINFELITNLLPAWVIIPFMAMLLSGLLSTIDSNLCAVSSLTTDMQVTSKLSNVDKIKVSKISMIIILVISNLIANVPGLTVTQMFLFYCTFRATTMLPTILTLLNVKLTSRGIVIGIITSLVVGLPVFAYGTIYNNYAYKTMGSILTVLLAGIIALLLRKRGSDKC